MTKGFVRLAACAASGAAFLALTGCGGGTPDSRYNTPPPADRDRVDRGTELMGAAPPARRRGDNSGLLGGPVDVDGRMDPIPNPADLTRAERVRYYGHKYDHLPEPRGRAAGQGLVTRQRGDGTLEVSMRPIANPEDMSAAERRRVYGYRYAPRAETRPAARQSVRTAPPAIAAKPVAAPAAKATPTPAAVKPAPKPVVAAPPAQTTKPAAPLVAAKPAPQPVQPLAKAPSPDLAEKPAATAVAPAPLAETIVENPAAETKGDGFKLPPLSLKALAIPGMPMVDVPGVGKVASEKVVGAVIALLALLLVIALARGASAGRAREERRRKFRTMQDYGRVDPDPEPAAPAAEPTPEPTYVNPMAAAAGGVAAGAVAAHAFHQEPAAAETPASVEYAAPAPEPLPEPLAHAPYDPHAAHAPAAPEISHDVPHAEPVEHVAPAETAHVETAHVETPHVGAPHIETAHHHDGDVPHVPAQPDPHHHREPEHA